MTDIKITVGGTPAGEGVVGCQCDDLVNNDFKRCEKHAQMMGDIADLYWQEGQFKGATGRSYSRLCNAVFDHADGYGEPGFVPDWSGVRDSSAYAIEQMHRVLQGGIK